MRPVRTWVLFWGLGIVMHHILVMRQFSPPASKGWGKVMLHRCVSVHRCALSSQNGVRLQSPLPPPASTGVPLSPPSPLNKNKKLILYSLFILLKSRPHLCSGLFEYFVRSVLHFNFYISVVLYPRVPEQFKCFIFSKLWE